MSRSRETPVPKVYECQCGSMVAVGTVCADDKCIIQRLQMQVQHLSASMEAARQQMFDRQARLASREASVAQREHEIYLKQQELAKNANTAGGAEQLRNQLQAAKKEIGRLKQDLEVSGCNSTVLARLKEEKDVLQGQLTEEKERVIALNQQVTLLEKKADSFSQKLTASNLKVTSLEQAASKQKTKYEKDLEVARNGSRQLQKELKEINESLKRERQRVKSLIQNCEQGKRLQQRLKEQFEAQSIKVQSLSGKLAQVKRQLKAAKQKHESRDASKEKEALHQTEVELVPLPTQLAELKEYNEQLKSTISKLKAESKNLDVEKYVTSIVDTYFSEKFVAASTVECTGLTVTCRNLRSEILKAKQEQQSMAGQLVKALKLLAQLTDEHADSVPSDLDQSPNSVTQLRNEITTSAVKCSLLELGEDMQLRVVNEGKSGVDAEEPDDRLPLYWKDVAQARKEAASAAADVFQHMIAKIESYVGGVRSVPSYPSLDKYANAVTGFVKDHCDNLVRFTDKFIAVCNSMDPILGASMKYFKAKIGEGTLDNTMYLMNCCVTFFEMACRAVRVDKEGNISPSDPTMDGATRTYVINIADNVEEKALKRLKEEQDLRQSLLQKNHNLAERVQKLENQVQCLKDELCKKTVDHKAMGELAKLLQPSVVQVNSDKEMEPFYLARFIGVVKQAYYIVGIDVSDDVPELLSKESYKPWAYNRLQSLITVMAEKFRHCRSNETTLQTELKRAQDTAVTAAHKMHLAHAEAKRLREKLSGPQKSDTAVNRRQRKRQKGRKRGKTAGKTADAAKASDQNARVVELFKAKIVSLQKELEAERKKNEAKEKEQNFSDQKQLAADTALRKAQAESAAEMQKLRAKLDNRWQSDMEQEMSNTLEQLEKTQHDCEKLALKNKALQNTYETERQHLYDMLRDANRELAKAKRENGGKKRRPDIRVAQDQEISRKLLFGEATGFPDGIMDVARLGHRSV